MAEKHAFGQPALPTDPNEKPPKHEANDFEAEYQKQREPSQPNIGTRIVATPAEVVRQAQPPLHEADPETRLLNNAELAEAFVWLKKFDDPEMLKQFKSDIVNWAFDGHPDPEFKAFVMGKEWRDLASSLKQKNSGPDQTLAPIRLRLTMTEPVLFAAHKKKAKPKPAGAGKGKPVDDEVFRSTNPHSLM